MMGIFKQAMSLWTTSDDSLQ